MKLIPNPEPLIAASSARLALAGLRALASVGGLKAVSWAGMRLRPAACRDAERRGAEECLPRRAGGRELRRAAESPRGREQPDD